VAGLENGTVELWENGISLYELTGHTDVVIAVKFVGKSMRIVSASCDNTFRVWSVASKCQLR
jgi:WD40 repeat protein